MTNSFEVGQFDALKPPHTAALAIFECVRTLVRFAWPLGAGPYAICVALRAVLYRQAAECRALNHQLFGAINKGAVVKQRVGDDHRDSDVFAALADKFDRNGSGARMYRRVENLHSCLFLSVSRIQSCPGPEGSLRVSTRPSWNSGAG
ncbi:hypothetical protein MPLA_830080 [Mesorhizobium sp. ORS 3359]|nr:hypothetical protein MPLA_830080 [Mesorhizobium sp. ORS 3359]